MTALPHLGTVQLPRLAAGRDEVLWPAMLDLAAALPRPWTLIGGQMVYLHGALVGRSPHRFTEDIDVVFDMRVEVDAITKAHRALDRLGYEVAGVSADGLAYRYRNGNGVEVDILAPDHLGERVLPKLHTPYGKTVQVPGARKALQHSCTVTATYGEREEVVFVPSLLTAINIKLKAIGLPGPTERTGSRHLDDIAFLVSLVDDPDTLLSDPVYKSLPLDAAEALDDAAHVSWRRLGDHAEDGVAAWTMLREG
ncbi:MAG: hypothetical protein WBA97_26815 [Actinophytocola sp.]|uniref:hypothetical protein n=1 Tax=Actinophytocola sp. TaxID=1872138 RepID=UPI003C78C46B